MWLFWIKHKKKQSIYKQNEKGEEKKHKNIHKKKILTVER